MSWLVPYASHIYGSEVETVLIIRESRSLMIRSESRKTQVFSSLFVIALTILASALFFLQVPVGAQLYSNLNAPNVQGSVDLNNPGGEGFWSGITGVDIPLTSSTSYGGQTRSITVKMANNGTHILVYATWPDNTESRLSRSICQACKDSAYPGLYYTNSTYSYEDRLVFWWSLDPTPGPPPCMTQSPAGLNGGASLLGEGNLWHWKAARTDSSGTAYGTVKYGSGPNQGQPIVPVHSYVSNEFINTTGRYRLGYEAYPLNVTIPFANNIHEPYDTFLVSAHGVYDSSVRAWKWVAARGLTTTPTLHLMQFEPGKTYTFAAAVFDGGPIPIPYGVAHPGGWESYGENEETKSISSWFTTSIASAGQTSGLGVVGSLETTLAVALGMLVVGFIAGVVVIGKLATPKKLKS